MPSRARRRQRQKKSLAFGLVLGFTAAIFAVLAIAVTTGYGMVMSWLQDLPDYTSAEAYTMSQKTRVYANDGETLLAEFYIEDRDPVSSDEVSQAIKDATVATEDERFYEHKGVDPAGIARALFVNATGGRVEGASTITQQFVRNTLLADEMQDRTLKRKVREAYLALQVEKQYSKDEILMMYLNTINYGDGAYGIESAAQHYFSKSAKDITKEEAAVLAAIPQSPTNNNPKTNPDHALERRDLVLRRMLSNGFITQEEYDEYVAAPLELDPMDDEDDRQDGIYKYPYFTSWVRTVLLDGEGDFAFTSDEVYKGGLTIYTTLDPHCQDAAEAACDAKLEWMDEDVEVSLTSIDPDTGYVVALVGGRDYDEDQFNLATQARRASGSCFKMFTLTDAIEHGISPETTIDCSSPVKIGNWRVENYGNSQMGNMSIQQATQVSSNTAYARLCTKLGPQTVVDVAHRMGITVDLNPVPSITLGSEGVNTLEMASAYGTLATGGIHHPYKFITKIEDKAGNVIYDAEEDLDGERALTPEVSYAVTRVLMSVVTGGTATSAQLYGQVSAGKTGTSNDYRDSMYCGYTPQLSTSVWIGSRNNRPIADNMGGSNCCPVWRNYMSVALEDMPYEEFPVAGDPPYDPDAGDDLAGEEEDLLGPLTVQ